MQELGRGGWLKIQHTSHNKRLKKMSRLLWHKHWFLLSVVEKKHLESFEEYEEIKC